ncbi:MAG: alpha/beta hydrolase family protein [Rhodospirillales bacterium]|nr:alpha/beta hydrolase family protein [Rhodospirillales bacterium]
MPRAGAQRRSLPRDSLRLLLRSTAGGWLLRPWFDAATLRILTQWYFPLSRAWAAALAADGSVDHFLVDIPCEGRLFRRMLPSILSRTSLRMAALVAADARWEEALFTSAPPSAWTVAPAAGLAGIEAARMHAAAKVSNLRASFVPLHMRAPLPPIAWAIESEGSVARRHGERLAQLEQAFAAHVDPAAVTVSRGFLAGNGVDRWVRFAAPTTAAAGTAWARVSSPVKTPMAAARTPSLIYAHGIGMEPEFTGDGRNPLAMLVGSGVRVIRPEGPWHGRRRLRGFYGGEPVLGRGPGGLLDYFHAHVIEIGLLVAWARATGGGPVAVGGVSLGALTAQLAAVAACNWPAEMRPDALFLVAPSHSLAAVTFEGSLTRALGVPAAIRAAGWTSSDIAHWRPLLDPTSSPAVPPERIVVLIGMTDDVTLAAGGETLVRSWALPEENVFRASAGHFSTSFGFAHSIAPLRQLLRILDDVKAQGQMRFAGVRGRKSAL